LNMYQLESPKDWCDGKGLEICIAGLEFKSGRAFLVSLGQPGFYSLTWTHKIHFPDDSVSSNPKKKKVTVREMVLQCLVFLNFWHGLANDPLTLFFFNPDLDDHYIFRFYLVINQYNIPEYGIDLSLLCDTPWIVLNFLCKRVGTVCYIIHK